MIRKLLALVLLIALASSSAGSQCAAFDACSQCLGDERELCVWNSKGVGSCIFGKDADGSMVNTILLTCPERITDVHIEIFQNQNETGGSATDVSSWLPTESFTAPVNEYFKFNNNKDVGIKKDNEQPVYAFHVINDNEIRLFVRRADKPDDKILTHVMSFNLYKAGNTDAPKETSFRLGTGPRSWIPQKVWIRAQWTIDSDSGSLTQNVTRKTLEDVKKPLGGKTIAEWYPSLNSSARPMKKAHNVNVNDAGLAGDNNNNPGNTTAGTSTTGEKKKDDGNGLSGGAIAGIAIGSVAGVALLGGLIYYLVKKNKNSSTA